MVNPFTGYLAYMNLGNWVNSSLIRSNFSRNKAG